MPSRLLRALALATVLSVAAIPAGADDAAPELPAAEDVLEALKRTLAWYQQARVATQAGREAGVVLTARDDEPIAVRVLERAFEVARGEAAVLARSDSPASPETTPASRRAERRATLNAAIREAERELVRLRERQRGAPASRRAALAREVTSAEHRLAVDRLRLELLASLEQADTSLAAGDDDLLQQIQALQESVPELNVSGGAGQAAGAGASPPAPGAPSAPAPAVGTWGAVRRLLALQRARGQLAQLASDTDELAGQVDVRVESTRTTVRELARRLRDEVAATTGDQAAERQFRAELQRLKLLGAVAVPLRAQAALLDRVEADLRLWHRAIGRETRHALQDLAVGLAGVAIALGAIGLGALVWRVATERYVTDPYRRRLLLRTRKIAAAVAVVLVIVFHFTDELTALVTALGFAAAGVAFALQNVILSVAGYFSMMSPNGIRVGDRVSLQGPFGYVHGEVVEIGLVRIRLRELAADTLTPTGRVVVFPNSVVFTGSFFKHPPAPAKAA
jgi:hypothetical protein